MFRISKVLNHNAVLAISMEDNQEVLLLGKGVGFGKKVSERLESRADDRIYTLSKTTDRGDAGKLARTIPPEYLEITNELLDYAEEFLGNIDRNVLFPLADHIEYAVKRVREGEEIRNPLTEDIQILFHMEYKVAGKLHEILKERTGLEIHEDEIGYVALHIHSAIEEAAVSEAMQMAGAVRKCIGILEKKIGHPISVMSLSYNRMMNHIRYMVIRALRGEKLKLNMNDYMFGKYPESYEMAKEMYTEIGKDLKKELAEAEVGYLAMHIERILGNDSIS